MSRHRASANIVPATVAVVLLAASSAYAQASPDRGWAALQYHAERAVAGRYPYRVTVRTAAGKATGDLRVVEHDRLVFGDRRSHLMIRARDEICEVLKSSHPLRPRTEAMTIALAGAVMWGWLRWLAKGEGKRGRLAIIVIGWLGVGQVIQHRTRPTLLYSNPAPCGP